MNNNAVVSKDSEEYYKFQQVIHQMNELDIESRKLNFLRLAVLKEHPNKEILSYDYFERICLTIIKIP